MRIVFCALIVLLLLTNNIALGKNNYRNDSLNLLLQNTSTDTTRINKLIALGLASSDNDTAKAFRCFNKAYEISKETNNLAYEEKCLSQLAILNFTNNKYKETINYSHKAADIYIKTNNLKALMLAYNRIGVAYFYLSDYNNALAFYQKANEISPHMNDISFNIKLLGNLGGVSNALGEYEKALVYFEKAIKESEKINEEVRLKVTYLNIGNTYYNLANFTQAIYYYNKGLKITEKLNDSSTMALFLSNIANIHTQLGNTQDALENYKKALDLTNESENKRTALTTFNNIGILYGKQGKDSLALSYYNQALIAARSISNQSAEAHALCLIGQVYQKQNKYNEALQFLDSALVIDKITNRKKSIARNYYYISEVYKELKNYNRALSYAIKSMEIRKDIKSNDALKSSYEQLALLYELNNNYKLAYSYHKKFKTLNDTIYSHENVKMYTAMKMQHKFDNEKRINELEQIRKRELLKAKIEKQNIMKKLSIVGFIFLTLFILYILRQYKIKKRRNLILLEKNMFINKQNNELEKVINSKNRFISILGHDLKNIIGGNIQLIDMLKHKGKDWDKKEEFIEYLFDNSYASYNLLDDIVTWGKASLGKTRFTPSLVNIYSVFEKQKQLFKTQLKQKNIKLSINCSEDITTWADENMLNTIVRNITKNAIKYTHPEGEITLLASANCTETEISVRDTGIGMAKEKAENFFNTDEFNSHPGTNGETGSGLGLQIVKEYVAINGGNIKLESELNKGTNVYLHFPVKA